MLEYVNLLKENFSMWTTKGSNVGYIWIALWVKWVPIFNPGHEYIIITTLSCMHVVHSSLR